MMYTYCYRGALWCSMLGLEASDADVGYFNGLKQSVARHHLLLDYLIYKDIKLTATNDDQYFVFEDYLYQVIYNYYTAYKFTVRNQNGIQ